MLFLLLPFCEKANILFRFWLAETGTGTPHFWKVHFLPLRFYKRPILVPVFANQNTSEEDFHLYEKSHDSTNVGLL